MKKKLFTMLLAIIGILSFASCSKDDGDWNPMKWENYSYETTRLPNGTKVIRVPKSGGTFTFKCTNYNRLWIESVTEGFNDKYVKNITSDNYTYIETNSTTVQAEGNTLTVTFAPNETQTEREVRVYVSVGDTGDKLVFCQLAE